MHVYCIVVNVIILGSAFFLCGYLKPTDSYFEAAAISINDLIRSTGFYANVLGTKLKERLNGKDVDQVILEPENEKGADVVLMHHKNDDQVNYTDNSDVRLKFDTGNSSAIVLTHNKTENNYTDFPIKLIYRVPDLSALIDSIESDGMDVRANAKTVLTTHDPDGYILKVLPAIEYTPTS